MSTRDDAVEDIPPQRAASTALLEVDDSDQAHQRKMDWSKLHFGIIVISVMLVGIIGLSLCQYYLPGVEGQSLNGAIDTLKLIGTIALGFVFGRVAGRGDG